MTLKTKFASFPSDQHHAVDAAVRIVTGDASFQLSRRMVVDKGAVLFHMTLRAGLRYGANQIGSVGSAVRVVAIRTLHRSFRNSMMHGQRELRLYRSVTGVTELRLRRLQQTVSKPLHIVRTGNDLEKLRLSRREFALA